MEYKKNVLALAGGAVAIAGASMYCLMAGAFPLEMQLLLVGIASACGGGLLVLAGQVAANDPPNPHADELNHQYRMAQLEVSGD